MNPWCLLLLRGMYTRSALRLGGSLSAVMGGILLVLLLGLGGFHVWERQQLYTCLTRLTGQLSGLRVQLLARELQLGVMAATAAAAAERRAQCSASGQDAFSWQRLAEGQRQVSAMLTFPALLQLLDDFAACEQEVISLTAVAATQGIQVEWVLQEAQ